MTWTPSDCEDGNDDELRCPQCGWPHSFSDWICEGWRGGRHACEGCGVALDITVDYSIDLTAKVAKS